ncbi:MAG TPA: DUF4910 domain-containing protein [Candidatus Krumholzibacteria bacterium]|nr:DUF4910 domain-containing protein [Candidatus Krumholzibacteria bacterium]HPD70991.1 DUF4910 domain-containing protein [Candidatus Krumholzibacteria bacterium]HRY39309.1 DUF4910 domain-containing protein [Candidatus Krumholzibacteria bacterium]
MSSMLGLIRKLAPLRRIIAAPDYDKAVAHLRNLLPFEVREYKAGRPHNGWVIPPRWEATEAVIRRGGEVVYDGLQHPLGVIALSAPFVGRVSLAELRSHLHYHHGHPEAIPFHYRQQFRSWRRDWGFCVPRRLYESLAEGEYEVRIQTVEAPGRLKVLEYEHRGRLDATIVIGADLDRPGVANDGVSGCAVGIELMQRLRGRSTKFSYRLVLVPGTIGSEYYLGRSPARRRAPLFEGVFLEMLGTPTPLALQRARGGAGAFGAGLARALAATGAGHRIGDFESVLINDEHVWEAYGIPMCSLSRFPYPQYHCSLDDAGAITEEALAEAAAVLVSGVDDLETTRLVTRRFTGTVCLSHPDYDLYVDPGEAVLGTAAGEEVLRLRRLMDLVPGLERPTTTRELAVRVGLPEAEVAAYLERWAAKGLIALD